METTARQQLSSLRRGLSLLAFFNQNDTLTTAAAAKRLGLPRTTTQRIITTLILEGYVERVPMSSLYRLTPAVNRLSGGFTDESWISHIASPLLFAKTQQIGWPLTLATPLGENMMVRVSTDQATTSALDHFRVGFKTPMMHSTSGRVMLAFASPEAFEALCDLLRRSSNPLQADIHNPEFVQHVMERIRRQGFEHIVYVDYPEASIAVPIFLNGKVTACLLAIYMKRAFKPADAEAHFVPILKGLAAEIEQSVVAAKERLASSGSGAEQGQVETTTITN